MESTVKNTDLLHVPTTTSFILLIFRSNGESPMKQSPPQSRTGGTRGQSLPPVQPLSEVSIEEGLVVADCADEVSTPCKPDARRDLDMD